MTLRINCWSGPRNVSTALMYSFRERTDTTVVDEPIYAHYLRVTGRQHPGDAEALATQDHDGNAVTREVVLGDYDTPVVFFKLMAHHFLELDSVFLAQCRNVLLIRDPWDMLTSLMNQLPDAQLADTGLENQVRLLDEIVAGGDTPVVIDSKALLSDPEGVLNGLCSALGIDFDPSMLSWPAGPKPEDGAWAPFWYESTHRSTGFAPHSVKDVTLPLHLEPVLAQAQPLYDRLVEFSIGSRL